MHEDVVGAGVGSGPTLPASQSGRVTSGALCPLRSATFLLFLLGFAGPYGT